MIELRLYFTDHHTHSAIQLQKIIATDWPIISSALQNGEDIRMLSGEHKCDHCRSEVVIKEFHNLYYTGKHRA